MPEGSVPREHGLAPQVRGASISSVSHPSVVPPPGFDDLPTEAKVDYVNALWDRLLESDTPESPHWHRELVRAEVAAHEADPAAVEEWEAVRMEIEQRLRASKR